MGHARALLSLENTLQLSTANKVIDRALSVRQTEELVKRTLNSKVKKVTLIEPHIEKIINSLSNKLNYKTEIKSKNNKGKIIIHFNTSDELNDIVKHIK
jgi:ParB family chromosome partitioning protein